MSNIKIVALVTVKPEYTETLAAQFKELVKASRAEEGNISYNLHQEIGKPNRFVFVEIGNPKQLLTNIMPARISKPSSSPSTAKPKRWKSY
ncbi:hypothetical protein TUM15746_09230 [Neisseria gonorrhoeae]|nr:antibiotic biosynthesis monooxygenase family protein [Neisseria gonorrhoeae]STZ84686.1 antibiotic biosynthesis monooxygenase family protein [Neisseria gonorrhoeae]GFL01140.1 hypothetical protein TUM15746_09230 [Neisseria gonorrhoeae]GFL02768.1 hypothetical protein TUM15747_04830 [Neisseria gonorrhoeae]GFL27289.1 hypothetical protein TUM15759_05080 [Neisseria gonorrhoeae]